MKKNIWMKRAIRLFCTGLLGGMVFLTACSDEEENLVAQEVPLVTFEDGRRLVFPEGELKAKTVISSAIEWKVSSRPEWLDIKVPESTVGTIEVEFNLLNLSGEERKGFVILSDKEGLNFKTRMLVTASAFGLKWELPEEISFGGGKSTVPVTVDWDVKLVAFEVENDTVRDRKADWISFSKSGSETFGMEVAKHTGKKARYARIYAVPENCDETLEKVKIYPGKELKQNEVCELWFAAAEDLNTKLTEISVLSGMKKLAFMSNAPGKIALRSCRFVLLENEGTENQKEGEILAGPGGYLSYEGTMGSQAPVAGGSNAPQGIYLMGTPQNTTPIWLAVDLVDNGYKITSYIKLLRQ